MDIERQLERALERKPPSPEFAARVLAAAQMQSRRRGVWSNWRQWIAAPLAASLLLLALGIEQRKERQEGEAAKAQLLQALALTSGKLEKIQELVREVQR
ncbi:MAG: hypothetical protein ABI823_11225 [Bryobacteraceae bacterium]